jgi:hypothetical protein
MLAQPLPSTLFGPLRLQSKRNFHNAILSRSTENDEAPHSLAESAVNEMKIKYLGLSLRGAKRRSNPFFSLCCEMDCFASLAMTDLFYRGGHPE